MVTATETEAIRAMAVAGDACWATAPASAAADLVGGLRDRGLDLAAAQVRADRRAGGGLVAQHPPGPGPRPAGAARAMRSRPISGSNASESWRCPELVTRASGRNPESASR